MGVISKYLGPHPSPLHRITLNLMIVSVFFMLRSDEALHISSSHITGVPKNFVGLRIASDKTNIEEKTLCRHLLCTCPSDRVAEFLPICPCCAIFDLLHFSKQKSKRRPYFIARGQKQKALKYKGFLDSIRQLMSYTNLPLRRSDGKWLYGSHSLRRGGAQALARAGWQLAEIQRWGRWESMAVLLYVLDAMYEASWKEVSFAIVGMEINKEKNPHEISKDDLIDFQGRAPLVDDYINAFSKTHQKWLQCKVILTPSSRRKPDLASVIPIWPVGESIYLVKLLGIYEDDDVYQVLLLNRSTKWMFCDDPRPFRTNRSRMK